eukprot:c9913_g1_i1.p1 GENE.c9913_g1_i1~~c9913_g1_i1.p1  ORF type:complete len:306 (+),score=39.61 c9913_g1_i1:75-992(+)
MSSSNPYPSPIIITGTGFPEADQHHLIDTLLSQGPWVASVEVGLDLPHKPKDRAFECSFGTIRYQGALYTLANVHWHAKKEHLLFDDIGNEVHSGDVIEVHVAFGRSKTPDCQEDFDPPRVLAFVFFLQAASKVEESPEESGGPAERAQKLHRETGSSGSYLAAVLCAISETWAVADQHAKTKAGTKAAATAAAPGDSAASPAEGPCERAVAIHSFSTPVDGRSLVVTTIESLENRSYYTYKGRRTNKEEDLGFFFFIFREAIAISAKQFRILSNPDVAYEANVSASPPGPDSELAFMYWVKTRL